MRKDGEANLAEKRAIFSSMSPKPVKDHWKRQFITTASQMQDAFAPRSEADLVRGYAMPVSAQALIAKTGLTNMHYRKMDQVSQNMIDGCSNYYGDPETTARCLIGQETVPMLFDRCPKLTLYGDATFVGWAFRGPLISPVCWTI